MKFTASLCKKEKKWFGKLFFGTFSFEEAVSYQFAVKKGDAVVGKSETYTFSPAAVIHLTSIEPLGMIGDTESAPKLRISLFRIRRLDNLDHFKYGTEIWMDEFMRAACAKGLGLMKDKPSLPTLKKALANEPVEWVRDEIEAAIKAIEG